jgi:hypothetical protein
MQTDFEAVLRQKLSLAAQVYDDRSGESAHARTVDRAPSRSPMNRRLRAFLPIIASVLVVSAVAVSISEARHLWGRNEDRHLAGSGSTQLPMYRVVTSRAGATYAGHPKLADVATPSGMVLAQVAFVRNGELCLGLGRAEHAYEYVQRCVAAPISGTVALAEGTGVTGERVLLVLSPDFDPSYVTVGRGVAGPLKAFDCPAAVGTACHYALFSVRMSGPLPSSVVVAGGAQGRTTTPLIDVPRPAVSNSTQHTP